MRSEALFFPSLVNKNLKLEREKSWHPTEHLANLYKWLNKTENRANLVAARKDDSWRSSYGGFNCTTPIIRLGQAPKEVSSNNCTSVHSMALVPGNRSSRTAYVLTNHRGEIWFPKRLRHQVTSMHHRIRLWQPNFKNHLITSKESHFKVLKGHNDITKISLPGRYCFDSSSCILCQIATHEQAIAAKYFCENAKFETAAVLRFHKGSRNGGVATNIMWP